MLLKILKKLSKAFLIFILMLVVFALTMIVIDASNTGYLKLSNNKESQTKSYIIRHVNVVPMNQDTVLNNKSIYIKEGVIEMIADTIPAFDDTKVIEGNHQYIMPGLMDMHVHVWDEYELGLYLANGVTAIRNVWGMPMHLRMKQHLAEEIILGPVFFTSGPKLTGPEFIGDDNLQLISIQDAKEKVIDYKNRGYDFIKTYNNLPKPYFDAIVEQAKASNMDIAAHPSQKVPYDYHFQSQIKSIEHAEDIVQQPLNYQLDTLKLDRVVKEFSNHKGTSFCPTLTAFYNIYNMLADSDILNSEKAKLMNASIRKVDSKGQFERWKQTKIQDASITQSIKDQHEFHLLAIKKLNQAGVNIICGTDSGIGVTAPGVSIHEELAFYKEAGLSNYEVLKTATVNASKTHSFLNAMGTLETGKIANMIVLNDNPLDHLRTLKKPQMVFVNGRKIERKQLEMFAKKARNRPNLLVSFLRYAEFLFFEK